MEQDINISAAIVTYNDSDTSKNAFLSVLKHTKKYPLTLYAVDNRSDDNTVELLSAIGGISVLRNEKNIGFGAAHNKVLSEKLGKYHFVINPDIEINCDVLSYMIDFFEENPDVVMAMPKIVNPDGTEQKLPKELPTFKRLFLGRLARFGDPFKRIREEYIWQNRELTCATDIDFCSGCCFGIRTDVFKALGGFDERFFMYLEDADITMRAKKYGRTVIIPDVAVTHLWHRDSAKKLRYFIIHLVSCIKFLLKRRSLK